MRLVFAIILIRKVVNYGNFDKFKSVNIDSSVNIIELCKKYSKRFGGCYGKEKFCYCVRVNMLPTQ